MWSVGWDIECLCVRAGVCGCCCGERLSSEVGCVSPVDEACDDSWLLLWGVDWSVVLGLCLLSELPCSGDSSSGDTRLADLVHNGDDGYGILASGLLSLGVRELKSICLWMIGVTG